MTYITDSNGLKVSTNGLAVPEPTTWAMLGLGGSALLGFRRRRDRAAVRQS